MKRVALMLTALAILFVAANAAEARGYHHGPKHGRYYGQYYGQYYGYRGPMATQPRVLMGTVLTRPQLYVPAPPPRYWYRPAPCYRYYAPAPHYNFYYRGRGLSFGFGF